MEIGIVYLVAIALILTILGNWRHALQVIIALVLVAAAILAAIATLGSI